MKWMLITYAKTACLQPKPFNQYLPVISGVCLKQSTLIKATHNLNSELFLSHIAVFYRVVLAEVPHRNCFLSSTTAFFMYFQQAASLLFSEIFASYRILLKGICTEKKLWYFQSAQLHPKSCARKTTISLFLAQNKNELKYNSCAQELR